MTVQIMVQGRVMTTAALEIVSSTDAASEISDEEDSEDALLVVVVPQKPWTTMEDRYGSSIVLLANELREHPLLSPCLENRVNSFLDVDLCTDFQLSHCAFKACPWTPDAVLCQPWSCHEDAWAVCNGKWYRHLRGVEALGIYGCCGHTSCLREHLIQSHGEVLDAILPRGAVAEQSFVSYLEAIAYKEQQKMPDWFSDAGLCFLNRSALCISYGTC